MKTILSEKPGLSIIQTTHSSAPAIQCLVFQAEASTKILYTSGNGDSATESSLQHIINPNSFLRVNNNDQIIRPDSRYQASISKQINQSICNISRLALEPYLAGVDFSDIKTVLRHSSYGISVFGNAVKSASLATKMAILSMGELASPEISPLSSILTIIRGKHIDLADFSAVIDLVSEHPLLTEETDYLCGAIEDGNLNDHIEVNITAIW